MKWMVTLFQGRYIKQMFEHSVSNWDPIEQDGKFLQVSGNNYITYKPSLNKNVDISRFSVITVVVHSG